MPNRDYLMLSGTNGNGVGLSGRSYLSSPEIALLMIISLLRRPVLRVATMAYSSLLPCVVVIATAGRLGSTLRFLVCVCSVMKNGAAISVPARRAAPLINM